jgi:predicted  nucleic acid-binding Zn-ribbon protein
MFGDFSKAMEALPVAMAQAQSLTEILERIATALEMINDKMDPLVDNVDSLVTAINDRTNAEFQ